jgi:lipoprotein-anchoring transpeptidase ErfK/SrfK
MRRLFAAMPPLLLLAACGLNGTDRNAEEDEAAGAAQSSGADPMASRDPAPGEQPQVDMPDAEQRPVMQAQVVLERLGFGAGVIDGQMGLSTTNALNAFQEANGLQVTGELDEPTRQALSRWNNISATRVVTIPEEWGRMNFQPVPDDPAAQAQMQRLGYESLDEALAERFHTTVEVLRQLNPGGRPAGAPGAAGAAGVQPAAASPSPTASPSPAATASPGTSPGGTANAIPAPIFRAGQQIRVPNVGSDRIDASSVDNQGWLRTLASLGVGTEQPKVARVVVSKSGGWLKAYDEADKLVAAFTVTTGSENDPLPLGEWGVKGVAYNPPFSYNPELFWDVPDTDEKQELPPGPNGPVGVVWIDLTKDHYGIHGTPSPETIGRAQSHGCVRLTNWDAARLAQMVSGSTKVLFEA